MKRVINSVVVLLLCTILVQGCSQSVNERPADMNSAIKAQPASQSPEPAIKESIAEQPPSDTATVATVNGESIALGELKMRLFRNRAMTYAYFREKYGAADSVDFWTKNFGGEIPLDKIKKESLDECVEIKIQQILGKQKGLNDDISYKSFLERLAVENKRRKQAVANNQVIYGPIQYNPVIYYNYLFSNMVIKLKEKLGNEDFNISIDELEKLYEAKKDQSYRNPDTVTVEKISIPFTCYKTQSSRLPLVEARAKAGQIKARLDKGEDFAGLAEATNADGSTQQQVFDVETQTGNEGEYATLRDEAMKLPLGNISGIFQDEESDTLYIIKCIDRKDNGYMPFQEMADFVKSDYVNKKYDELIKKTLKDATVAIDYSVYDQIKMRE